MKKIIIFSFIFMAGCDQLPENNASTNKVVAEEKIITDKTVPVRRWYTPAQLNLGQQVYEKNCIECHKQNAVGTKEWKKTLANGEYPPPPLNGSAHAWHHDIGTLTRTVQNGGLALGGVMPGFKGKLTASEIQAVIAYFQSFWSAEIYNAWLKNGGLDAE